MKVVVRKMKTLLLIALISLPVVMFGQTMEEAKKAFNQGIEAFNGQDLQAAIDNFNQCIDICATLYEDEENEEAEELMYSTMEKVPGLYYNLAVQQIKNKEIEVGIENAQKAKETGDLYDDDDTYAKAVDLLANVYTILGGMKMKKQDYTGAQADFDKAIAEKSDYAKAYFYKAVVSKEQDDDAGVKDNAKKAIEFAGTDRKMSSQATSLAHKHFLKKGNDAKGSSNYNSAVDYLNSALEFEPTDGVTLTLLAASYSAMGKYDMAIETASKAVDQETDLDKKYGLYFEIASAYEKSGNTASACEYYSKVTGGAYLESAKYQMEHVLKCQ